jgi:probable phosphoglycerate mutase
MSANALLMAELGISEPVAVFTSPRRRAEQTARLALRTHGGTAVVTDSLAEFDYGDYEGLTSPEISALAPTWDLWRDGCPGGEAPTDIVRRAGEFAALAEQRAGAAGGGIVVAFTHGHFSRGLVTLLLGLPLTSAGALVNDTASVAVVRQRRGAMTLAGWNLRPPGSAPRPH